MEAIAIAAFVMVSVVTQKNMKKWKTIVKHGYLSIVQPWLIFVRSPTVQNHASLVRQQILVSTGISSS